MSKTIKVLLTTLASLILLEAVVFSGWYIYANNIFGVQCMIEHDIATVPAKSPTCTEDGCTESAYCQRCGEIFVASNAIAATGHKIVVTPGTPATCTKAGTTKKEECSVCNEVITAQEVVPSTGHQLSDWSVVKAATCTVDGKRIRTCKNCSYSTTGIITATGHAWGGFTYNNDATCTVDGTMTASCRTCGQIKKKIATNTSGHTLYTVPASAPTCSDYGWSEGKKCSVCDYIAQYRTPTSDPLGHDVSNFTYNNDATCTTNGSESGVCARCHDTVTRIVEGTAGHKLQTIPATPATCTTEGLSEGSVCSVCGYIAKAQTKTNTAVGHKWTFSISGNTVTYSCSVCSEIKTEQIKPISATIKQTGSSLIVSTNGTRYGYQFAIELSGGVGKLTYTFQVVSSKTSTTVMYEERDLSANTFGYQTSAQVNLYIRVIVTDERGTSATFHYSQADGKTY